VLVRGYDVALLRVGLTLLDHGSSWSLISLPCRCRGPALARGGRQTWFDADRHHRVSLWSAVA
jgi:hypothetical protein